MTFLGCIPPNPFEVPLAEAIPLADQPHLLQVTSEMGFWKKIAVCFFVPHQSLLLTQNAFVAFQPNARKEDLFGRPSQGLYSSSANSGKCLVEVTVDRNCLEVYVKLYYFKQYGNLN